MVWTEALQTNLKLTEAHQRINELQCHNDYVLYYAPGSQQGYPVPRISGASGNSGACGGGVCDVYSMVEHTLWFVEVLLESQKMLPNVLPAVLPSPGNLLPSAAWNRMRTGPVARPEHVSVTRGASEQRAKAAASLKDTRAHSVRRDAPAGARFRGEPRGVPGVREVRDPAGLSLRRREA